MEHTSGALRSRNSASLAPEHMSGRQSASMVGREVVLEQKSEKKQPNVSGCLGWLPGTRATRKST